MMMMLWCFMSFSTLHKSYHDNGRVIMKGNKVLYSLQQNLSLGPRNPRLGALTTPLSGCFKELKRGGWEKKWMTVQKWEEILACPPTPPAANTAGPAFEAPCNARHGELATPLSGYFKELNRGGWAKKWKTVQKYPSPTCCKRAGPALEAPHCNKTCRQTG